MERYDRTSINGRWRRLHQEDYCQAFGKPPTAKYESNQTGISGPGLKDIFELTRRRMSSLDILRLLDMVVLNVLVCNTDAHAKNYSIMIRLRSAPWSLLRSSCHFVLLVSLCISTHSESVVFK
jgi:serine/threonine-protein kinase HipA